VLVHQYSIQSPAVTRYGAFHANPAEVSHTPAHCRLFGVGLCGFSFCVHCGLVQGFSCQTSGSFPHSHTLQAFWCVFVWVFCVVCCGFFVKFPTLLHTTGFLVLVCVGFFLLCILQECRLQYLQCDNGKLDCRKAEAQYDTHWYLEWQDCYHTCGSL